MNIQNREPIPEDASFTETGTSLRPPITVIPIFVGIGLLSGFFAMWFWSGTFGPPHNEYLFELLASSILGLALVAVLWSLRLIPSWGAAITIVAATIAAHSLEQFLDPYLLRDENPCWDCFPTGSFAPGTAIRLFLVASIVGCSILTATAQRRRFLRPLLIAIGSSALSAATIGVMVPIAQRLHADLVFNGVPLWIVWQLVLASYLGVAVWASKYPVPFQ